MKPNNLYPSACDIYRSLVGVPHDELGTSSYAQRLVTGAKRKTDVDTADASGLFALSAKHCQASLPSEQHQPETAPDAEECLGHLRHIAENAEGILACRLGLLGENACFGDKLSVFREVQAWALQAFVERLGTTAAANGANSNDVIKLLTQLNWMLHSLLGFESSEAVSCEARA